MHFAKVPFNINVAHGNRPVALPCVNDFWVDDVVSFDGAVEEVKEVFDGRWQRAVGPQDCHEQVIDELLQCALGTVPKLQHGTEGRTRGWGYRNGQR